MQQGVAAEDLDQSGVGLVGLFFSILYSWIIYRSSERIQEEKVYHFRATLNKLSGFFVIPSALQVGGGLCVCVWKGVLGRVMGCV